MVFRDDSDALRARIEALESELEQARARLAQLEDAESERARLATRVEELEAQLQKHDPAAKKKERDRKDAEAKEKLRKMREEHGRGSRARGWTTQQKALAAGVALLVLAPLTWLFVVPHVGLAPQLPPTLGLVDLAATPTPTPILGATRGTESAGFGCTGYVPSAPQIVVRTREATLVRFAPSSTTGDLVLVVETSDGQTLCDDDSGDGTNPAISATLPPGDTRVFVGTYQEDQSHEFALAILATDGELVVDATGLAPSATPLLEAVSLARGETRELSYTGDVRAAWTEASRAQAACRGYLPEAPHLVVTLSEESTLLLTARAREDLVMLVRSTTGLVRCDDDSGGSNWPRIATLLAPGEYGVWVGTYSVSDGSSVVPFSLTGHIASVGARTEAATAIHTIPADGTALTLTVTSAGEVTPLDLGAPPCGGLVPARAQVGLRVDAAHDVSLEVRGTEASPPALLRHPDGRIECVSGLSTSTWQPGEHELFVGVTDGATPTELTIVARAAPPTIQPWRP